MDDDFQQRLDELQRMNLTNLLKVVMTIIIGSQVNQIHCIMTTNFQM